MTTITARQRWQRAYSDARYWPQGRTRDEVLRYALFKFFGPAIGRAFSAPFDRNIAAASAVPWYLAGGAPTPIAVYQPKGAASLAASYVNLVNPGTYDAAPGVAPSLGVGGWSFDGTSWLDTQYIPKSNQDQAFVVKFSDAAISYTVLFGAQDTTNGYFVLLTSSWFGAGVLYIHGGTLQVAPELSSGVLAMAGDTAYRNGVAETTTISPGSGTIGLSIYIGCRNIYGPNLPGISTIAAWAAWDASAGHATWMPAVMAACALI